MALAIWKSLIKILTSILKHSPHGWKFAGASEENVWGVPVRQCHFFPVISVCLVAKTILYHHFCFINFSSQQKPFITQQFNVTIGQENARMFYLFIYLHAKNTLTICTIKYTYKIKLKNIT